MVSVVCLSYVLRGSRAGTSVGWFVFGNVSSSGNFSLTCSQSFAKGHDMFMGCRELPDSKYLQEEMPIVLCPWSGCDLKKVVVQ